MKRKPSPRIVDGLTRLAAVIQEQFKIPCSKQSIKYWQRKNPPFPVPTSANRYETKPCFEWITTHIISKHDKTAQGDLFRKAQESDARLKITKDESAAFDFEVKQGRYIERKLADDTIRSSMKRYHGFVRSEIESNATAMRRDKLAALGISAEIVAQFHEFDLAQVQAMTARIEDACEAEANGL